jgi:hypothetical protein
MAAGTPLTRLTLGAASVADDLGYVALSDRPVRLPSQAWWLGACRLLGGHNSLVIY